MKPKTKKTTRKGYPAKKQRNQKRLARTRTTGNQDPDYREVFDRAAIPHRDRMMRFLKRHCPKQTRKRLIGLLNGTDPYLMPVKKKDEPTPATA